MKLRLALITCALLFTLRSEAEDVSDLDASGTSTYEAGGGNSSDGDGNSFVLNYTNIFYGPSVQHPSSFMPNDDGSPDRTRPIYMRNFLSATYMLGSDWSVTGTAYWWYRPVLGGQFTLQDPFVRVSNSSLFSTDWGLNLYSDLRVHFGVTDDSRYSDRIGGVQSFNYLSYQPDAGRLTLALRASARYNLYGKEGVGTETELYFAPEANYRLSANWALTALYEMGGSRQVGDPYGYFGNDGSDFEPGFEWDPTPDIAVNPYLIVLTNGGIQWKSTSLGVFFTWSFL